MLMKVLRFDKVLFKSADKAFFKVWYNLYNEK